jgi:hypothetical protein
MNQTEKILAKLDERIKSLSNSIKMYQTFNDTRLRFHITELEEELAIYVALRRQVEKHTIFQITDGFYCNECSDIAGVYRNRHYPCTFIKELANDLGISE